MERESHRCLGLHCVRHVPNLAVVQEGEKDIPGLIDAAVPHARAPKELAEPTNVSISRADAVQQCAIMEPAFPYKTNTI